MKTPFRVGRATAGVAFLLAVPVLRGRLLRAVAVWFGLSHLTAAATGYRGCPELGAIASRSPACSPTSPSGWDVGRGVGSTG